MKCRYVALQLDMCFALDIFVFTKSIYPFGARKKQGGEINLRRNHQPVSKVDKKGTSPFVSLDITYRIFDYAQFEEGKVQNSDKVTCIPELLYVHNEKYSVVYDGKSSVYMFNLDNGMRQGRMYYGKPGTYREFLSIGERMFGVDGGFNLKEYNFENMEWMESTHTFNADIMGIRDKKFWLWDIEGKRIFSSTPDGKETTVHSGVSVEVEEGINLEKLNEKMLVYDKKTFILYDGTYFLKLEKK